MRTFQREMLLLENRVKFKIPNSPYYLRSTVPLVVLKGDLYKNDPPPSALIALCSYPYHRNSFAHSLTCLRNIY